jgi:hypothetical protein
VQEITYMQNSAPSPCHLDFTLANHGDGANPAYLHLLSPQPFRGGEKVKKVQRQGEINMQFSARLNLTNEQAVFCRYRRRDGDH